ncbi:universal stress protein [Nonomuraea mangrovi]|uniref:Universal stress protein n=1 Tax=Nonomuraea mangrovi TaxID=2316207 RepID=A0ABW4SL49_9ACTN
MNVIVGYDGSDYSMQALDWAMDEAELRKLPLTVVHAWQWPYGEADEEAKSHLRKAADHVLWHGAECARHAGSVGKVETDLYEGSAVERLVTLSEQAELVVVGSRGMGGLPLAVLGSVATQVATLASCPVVVVRGAGPLPSPAHPGPVVVTEMEEAVLEFAFKEASQQRLPLLTLAPLPENWSGRYPDVPAKAGTEVPQNASLLVAGRPRHGHLGRLADALLREARCPVAVVPLSREVTP